MYLQINQLGQKAVEDGEIDKPLFTSIPLCLQVKRYGGQIKFKKQLNYLQHIHMFIAVLVLLVFTAPPLNQNGANLSCSCTKIHH